MNTDEIVRSAEKLGFEVVVSEGTHEVAPFTEITNSCDAIMGVHGTGLTNMVFLPSGGVAIQIVPLGGLLPETWAIGTWSNGSSWRRAR
jgi:capsular polysaccharide biosynthesis protein